MAKLAEDMRAPLALWSAVVVLIIALAAVSFHALAEEPSDENAGAAVSADAGAASSSSDSAGFVADSPSSSAANGATSAAAHSAASASASSLSDASASSGGASSSSAQDQLSSASHPGIANGSDVDRALAQSAIPKGTKLNRMDADSAGTVFTFTSPIEGISIEGDLYWAGQRLELLKSRILNDVLGIGFNISLSESDVLNDVRVAGQNISLSHAIVQGHVDALAADVRIDEDSAATGYYCGGGSISYEGKSKRLIAYGQSIYFNGVVEGDVTLSAQDIVIGPQAKVTGTLDIRSGQSLEVLGIPETAQITAVDTTLNQPNTIDQITQIRAAIAPYFQVGSLLFVVVSFIILGLSFLWSFGHKLTEANRLIRRYPLAVVVLGCIALMLMFVAVMLGSLLVFTIPFAVVVLLFMVISAICCIPFTGASLMLMLRDRIRPAICVILGAGIAGALVFVPYVNLVVFSGSLVYFMGYLVNIAMFGHDKKHDASFHLRGSNGDGSHGGGILPVSTAGAEDAAATTAATTATAATATAATATTAAAAVEPAAIAARAASHEGLAGEAHDAGVSGYGEAAEPEGDSEGTIPAKPEGGRS